MASGKLTKNDFNAALAKAGERTKRAKNYMSDIEEGSNKLIAGSKYGRRGSIINQAKQNIFEFPVFVSNSVPLEYATATNSLLEQVYASYLQMAISINPVIDSENIKDQGFQFANFKADTNKYLEYTDMSYAHDACHAVYTEDDYVFEFDMMYISDSDAQIINEHCDYEPLSEFSHYFQEDGEPKPDPEDKRRKTEKHEWARNAEDRAQAKEQRDINKEKRDIAKDERDNARASEEHEWKRNAEDRAQAKEQRDINKEKRDIAKDERDNARASEEHEWKRNAEDRAQAREKREAKKDLRDKKRFENEERRAEEKHAHDTKIKAAQFIDESKIQKLNTMKPLMMTVNMSYKSNDGNISRPIEYVVGVKTHCRIVDADILPEVAEYPIKEMDKLSRKAKWRAGELKFWKDIVFNIKGKKQSAIDSRDPKRKWYRRLYDLAHMQGDATTATMIEEGGKGTGVFKAFMKTVMMKKFRPTGIMPNVAMIISKSDVDNIKAQTKIDLLKGSTAKSFCSELFLIALVVIDTDAESIKMMMPDLHDAYEVHSLASVNKQLASLDTVGTKTRDILKALK